MRTWGVGHPMGWTFEFHQGSPQPTGGRRGQGTKCTVPTPPTTPQERYRCHRRSKAMPHSAKDMQNCRQVRRNIPWKKCHAQQKGKRSAKHAKDVKAKVSTDQTRAEPYQSNNGHPKSATIPAQLDPAILSPVQVYQVSPSMHEIDGQQSKQHVPHLPTSPAHR